MHEFQVYCGSGIETNSDSGIGVNLPNEFQVYCGSGIETLINIFTYSFARNFKFTAEAENSQRTTDFGYAVKR